MYVVRLFFFFLVLCVVRVSRVCTREELDQQRVVVCLSPGATSDYEAPLLALNC